MTNAPATRAPARTRNCKYLQRAKKRKQRGKKKTSRTGKKSCVGGACSFVRNSSSQAVYSVARELSRARAAALDQTITRIDA